jgi:hypothetical protein
MWVDPDPIVSVARDMLQACPAWGAAGGGLAQIHYPHVDDLDVTVAPLPRAWILSRPSFGRAFTGVELPSATLEIGLHAWGRQAVALADIGAQRIEIAGDHTGAIVGGSAVRVAGTDSALDAWYEVATAAYSAVSGRTEIDTVNAVPSEAIGGGSLFFGEVERLAAQIARELQAQDTGLYLTDVGPEVAQEPEDGSTADYVTIMVRLTAGLEVSG